MKKMILNAIKSLPERFIFQISYEILLSFVSRMEGGEEIVRLRS